MFYNVEYFCFMALPGRCFMLSAPMGSHTHRESSICTNGPGFLRNLRSYCKPVSITLPSFEVTFGKWILAFSFHAVVDLTPPKPNYLEVIIPASHLKFLCSHKRMISRRTFISTRKGHLMQTEGTSPWSGYFSPLATERQGWRAPRRLLQYPSLLCAETRGNLPENTPEETNPKMENWSLSREHEQFHSNSSKTCCVFIKCCIYCQEREFMVPETY